MVLSSGCSPANQAMNILDASWVLPCRGGRLMISRRIRPRVELFQRGADHLVEPLHLVARVIRIIRVARARHHQPGEREHRGLGLGDRDQPLEDRLVPGNVKAHAAAGSSGSEPGVGGGS